jgi:hypothetical protein
VFAQSPSKLAGKKRWGSIRNLTQLAHSSCGIETSVALNGFPSSWSLIIASNAGKLMVVSYIAKALILLTSEGARVKRNMINKNLIEIYDSWLASGSPQQEGFDWISTREKWLDRFPADSEFIESLPKSIDRCQLREICASKEVPIRQSFLAVMIWGYGDRAYGPFRVGQMFNQSNTDHLLSEAFDLAESGNPIQAYTYLSKNKIHGLGPSYTSKFVSFCTPRTASAPIFDSFISMWLASYAKSDFEGFSLSSQNWNIQRYSRYVEWIQEHALNLNANPDDLELVIFRDAEDKFSKSSKWATK